MSTLRATSIMHNYVPKRNDKDLIEPSEYKHVLDKAIPNIMVEITYFDHKENKAVTESKKLHEVLGNGPFLMDWQPGASTKFEADNKLYSSLPGAPGCSGELFGLDEVCPQLNALGLEKLLVCSTKSSEQQRQVFADRDKELVNKKIIFISDTKGTLAKALGLFLQEDKTKNITFVERINLFGNNLKINDYICAAQMKDPAAPKLNALDLPDYVKQKLAIAKQQNKDTEMKTTQSVQTEQQAQPKSNETYNLRSRG